MTLDPLSNHSFYINPIQPENLSENNKFSLPVPILLADTTTSSKTEFTIKKADIQDTLLQELENVLHAQEIQIEKELQHLESHEKNKNLVNVILETESWISAIPKTINTTHGVVKEGIEFLENVLPPQFLKKLPLSFPLDALGRLITLNNIFLKTLDCGSQGLAIIYKTKILEQSKTLIEQVQESYRDVLHKQISSPQELPALHKMVLEWKTHLKLAEELLVKEKLQFTMDTTSKGLFIVNIPLMYFPREPVIEHIKIATTGISWITSVLEIFALGLELRKSTEASYTFNKWANAYKKWQIQQQPQFKITEEGVQREPFSVAPALSFSFDKHQKALDEFLQQAPNLHFIRSQLKDLDIELDANLKSKNDLFVYLANNPYDHTRLVFEYVTFKRKLEALNEIIYTSANLLEKRQAIVDKKVLFLKPHFHTVEAKIKELKKDAFIREMQKMLREQMQDSTCSPQEIKLYLQKWGFYEEANIKQNQHLIEAFKQFEASSLEDTAFLKHKQNLIEELGQWMDHPTALDAHFQIWYALQSEESLLHFYVDHQETLELPVKNALKQMVQQKHEIESRFINFKLTKSRLHFSVAIVALTISLTLAVLGLLSIPFGGAGLILLMVSVGSTALSLGLLGASYYQAYREKPHASKLLSLSFQAKHTWAKLRSSIHIYSNQMKEKKLLEVAKILHHLHLLPKLNEQQEANYQKVLADYKQAKIKFEESQEAMQNWTKNLNRLEAKLAKKSWKDFAQQASLKVDKNSTTFDTLHAFQEALQACDLRLLSQESKTLLEIQLGIDLEALQLQMSKDPDAVKNTLQEFFVLDDADFVSFIRKTSQKRLKLPIS